VSDYDNDWCGVNWCRDASEAIVCKVGLCDRHLREQLVAMRGGEPTVPWLQRRCGAKSAVLIHEDPRPEPRLRQEVIR